MSETIPFDFSSLPKVSRQEAELLASLQGYLPRIGFTGGLAARIKSTLRQHLGPSFSFEVESVKTVSVGATLSQLPSSGLYLVIGLVPVEPKAVCEVDLVMAHRMIDQLLGGSGEPMTMLRPLSDIEQGVFSYLVLKVLLTIYEQCGKSARVHFRLEGIKGSPQELIGAAIRPNDKAVALTGRLTLEDQSGYLKLLLPSPFVQKGLLEPLGGAPVGDAEETAGRLEGFGFLETDLWAEVGKSTVKVSDLRRLDPGDVLLLDESTVRLKKGQPISGHATLRLGRGTHGSFRGKIVNSNPLQVEIERIG